MLSVPHDERDDGGIPSARHALVAMGRYAAHCVWERIRRHQAVVESDVPGVPQRSHVIGSPLCCVVRSQEAAAYLTSTGWVDRSVRAAAARFGFPMILPRESVVVLSGCSPSSPRS